MRTEHVQTLWSGYGEVVRQFGEDGPVIVKNVRPPSGSGISHRRKLRSYDVEMAFYTDFAARSRARVPRAITLDGGGGSWRFVLEDLDAVGFSGRHRALRPAQRDACLRWLAAFHAGFLGTDPTGLWEVGTYWHLATRPDELARTADRALKQAASELDARLSSARFQTLVHGDAKLANFCFHDGQGTVAAVDFQYVGGGCGMKDVAYFLSSFMSPADSETVADESLDVYFRALRARLPADVDVDALEAEWRELYPLAWADFHRFLSGWAPHYGVSRYERRLTRRALQAL